MVSVWQILLRIVAVAGSVGTAMVLAGGALVWLVRRSGSKKPRGS